MGEVEMFINEEGTLKVVQRYDLRVVLRRMRPKGVECHHVVRRPNCSCLCDTDQAKFISVLRFFFIITVVWTLISLVIYGLLSAHPAYSAPYSLSHQTWLFGPVPMGQTGIVVLGVFAAVLTVGVLMKKAPRTGRSALPRKQAVPTVSSLVLQV